MRYDELHEHPDHDVTQHPPIRREAEARTQSALTPGAPAAVQRAGMLDLQRAAGNASAARLVEDEDPAAAVRGVVGSGGGQHLDRDTRSFMESRLGADFSGVRVHTDSAAAASAQRMSAHAYTVGEDVVFGQGRYDPSSDAGKRTLAHELTHVVQQRSGPVSGTPMAGGISVSDPSDSFEQAAEHSADAAMSGGAPASPAAAPVQREAAPEEEELQGSFVQREAAPEDEELQGSFVQREAAPEEEELQGSFVQRQDISDEEAQEEELAAE
jgi:hypothetical protein